MNERDVQLGNGLLLGDRHDVFVAELDLGDSDYVNQDAVNPLNGSTVFGRDYLSRGEVTMTLYSNKSDMREAFDSLRPVSEFWSRGANMKPGEYTSLSFMLGGQRYTVFGRPRKHAVVTDKLTRSGVAKTVVTFARADNLFYSDPESLTLRLNGSPRRGLRAPVKAPVTTGAGSYQRQGMIENSHATAGSPFTVTFSGPIRNPWVQVGGKKLTVNVSIPYDRKVIVDTRSMSVRWNGGANINSALSQSTRLSQMKIPAGSTEITFGGTDETNLSTAQIDWYPARHSL